MSHHRWFIPHAPVFSAHHFDFLLLALFDWLINRFVKSCWAK